MVRNSSIARSVLECRNLWISPIVKIKIEDLPSFKSFKLINAMLPLDESRPLPISIIRL